ncbi:hypothetical protein [Labrys neptuniae]
MPALAQPELFGQSAAERAAAEAAPAALKPACGDHYRAPEIISFPISGPTVLDAMAVTGNF